MEAPWVLPPRTVQRGKGGYFIASIEKFDDRYEHDSLWHLAPDGSTERIACNPYGSFGYGKAALAPDALYVSTKSPAPMGSIVRIGLGQQP